MNSKNIFIVALGALCGLAIAPGMAQAKDTKISGRYAQTSVTQETFITTEEGKGTFGKYTSRTVGEVGDPIAPSENCEGFDFELPLLRASGVITYNDHSQLYGVQSSGYVCGNVDGARAYVAEYEVVGGSGRFEGATGSVTFEAEGTAVSDDISAYQGTFSGTVSLDD